MPESLLIVRTEAPRRSTKGFGVPKGGRHETTGVYDPSRQCRGILAPAGAGAAGEGSRNWLAFACSWPVLVACRRIPSGPRRGGLFRGAECYNRIPSSKSRSAAVREASDLLLQFVEMRAQHLAEWDRLRKELGL
jgi:hypothetical protein